MGMNRLEVRVATPDPKIVGPRKLLVEAMELEINYVPADRGDR
jgi:hypothetical protein